MPLEHGGDEATGMALDQLAQQVHDALVHLYDTVYLQTHPLAERATREPGGRIARAGQALRHSLIDAIETLRPSLDEEAHREAWRSYHILNLRYAEGLDIPGVQQRLAISKSTYYRAFQRALQAITSVLRARWAKPADPSVARLPRLPIPLTSFLGRERELPEVMRLLTTSRLLTLTGAPGTGKTRLALEVAARVADTFRDGVCFVPLASVTEPAFLLPALAQAVGVVVAHDRPLQSLADDLGGKQALLLLDNCEQLVTAAPELIEVLAACPGLKMLVTSRARLHVRGEREFAVPPLELPPPLLGVARVARRPESYAAVALFLDRARDVVPDFALGEADAAAVAEICHRLDGLPLAIELAAARVKLLPPALMLRRMERRLPLLTGGPRDLPARQQTLQAAIAWSYDLLDADEQAFLRRLAVCAGGATPEAEEAVCSGQSSAIGDETSDSQRQSPTTEVLDRLESLASKSLVVQATSPTPAGESELRFSLLETIREFALERLAESGEAEAVQRRHAAYFLALAQRAEPHLAGPRQGGWMSRLERDHPNLRTALDWWIARGDVAHGLRMASALVWFWALRGHLQEGRERMETLLASSLLAGATADRASALQVAATLANHQRDFGVARSFQEESLQILRALDDREGIVSALSMLGAIALQQRDHAAAREAFQENLAICRALENPPGITYALSCLANIAHEQGEYAEARALHRQCLAVCQSMQFNTGIAVQLHHLAMIAEDEGDYAEARVQYEQSLVAWQADDDQHGVARALLHLGSAATAQGDHGAAYAYLARALALMQRMDDTAGIAMALERCARLAAAERRPAEALTLVGAATALRERIGIPRPPSVAAQLEEVLAAVRPALGADAAAAWNRGQTLTAEQAIVLATGPR